MAQLGNGVYEISSAASPGHAIGRSPTELLDLSPKQVFNLPSGVQPSWPWIVLKKGDDVYELKATGSPTGPYEDRVYAFLQDEKPAEWIITYVVTTTGKEGWIVEFQLIGGRIGWVASGINEEEQGQPIVLRPLTPTKSLPPQYPPDQVFLFEPIVLDK